jgi:hypothetical protein
VARLIFGHRPSYSQRLSRPFIFCLDNHDKGTYQIE